MNLQRIQVLYQPRRLSPFCSRRGRIKVKNIVAVSSEPILAEGLRTLLTRMEGFALSAVYSSHYLLFDSLRQGDRPSLLVVETSSITLQVLAQLKSEFGDTPIVLWAEDVEPEFAAQALHLGIRAFLPMSSALELYVECFRTALDGGIWMPAGLNTKLDSLNETDLTPRERELTMLLLRGLKNRAIASKMGIAEGTVKAYLSHLFQKVGANDRFDLALLALRNMVPNRAAGLSNLEARAGQNGTPFRLSRFVGHPERENHDPINEGDLRLQPSDKVNPLPGEITEP